MESLFGNGVDCMRKHSRPILTTNNDGIFLSIIIVQNTTKVILIPKLIA